MTLPLDSTLIINSRFKLIALDLDGTLLNDEKVISDESKFWIQKAVEHGIIVIFSTGRGMQTAKALWDELSLPFPMVLLNGAEIWSKPGHLMERTLLTESTIRRLHQLASSRAESYWGYSIESLTGSDHWNEESFKENWMKFGICSSDAINLANIQEELARWDMLHITSSHPTNLEISMKDITKESGVRKVCAMLNISMDEIIAIGDSDNDLLLLKAAGLGIAMGNAEERIKLAANTTTLSNNDHGVAAAIKQYIFNMS